MRTEWARLATYAANTAGKMTAGTLLIRHCKETGELKLKYCLRWQFLSFPSSFFIPYFVQGSVRQ